MSKDISLEESVNAFLKWVQIRKYEINNHLKTMHPNSEYTQRLKGKLSCLSEVEDACEALGLQGEVMKDFDVNIKLNVMAKDEEDCRLQVHDILTAVAETGLSNVIQIRKVGEYLD